MRRNFRIVAFGLGALAGLAPRFAPAQLPVQLPQVPVPAVEVPGTPVTDIHVQEWAGLVSRFGQTGQTMPEDGGLALAPGPE